MNDADTRLTPLGVMLVALLREGDMHPYEMLRLLRARRDDRLVRIQQGTLYHTVSRLEREGFVAEIGVDREGNRPERTTYTLTDLGVQAVLAWVRRELPRVDHPDEFRVALAEAHNLPADEVLALLRQRRERLAADLASVRAALTGASHRHVAEQFLIESGRDAALLTADLTWLDGIIERLADGSLPWGVDDLPPSPDRIDPENQDRP